ncbi:chorismate-binding protein [Serratia marcescens]|nr:chorismate-binding protein [Serratia marcescens]
MHCSAGGGIVADSQEQAEYQETFDKVGRILPQRGVCPVVIPSNSPASLHAFISRFQLQLPQARRSRTMCARRRCLSRSSAAPSRRCC